MIIKMIFQTVDRALETVEKIADSGGTVCVVMSESTPTRCVISTARDTNKALAECDLRGITTSEPSEWDLDYFRHATK